MRIFTKEEILSNRIPNLGDFSNLHQLIKGEIEKSPLIVDALVFGSFLWGSQNILSDYNLMLTYDSFLLGHPQKITSKLQRIAHNRHIPLNLILVDTDSVYHSNCHPIDEMILFHLALAANHGGVIKGDPLGYFVPKSPYITIFNKNNYEQLMENYLRYILSWIEEKYSRLAIATHEEKCKLLKRGLETPINIARKIIIGHRKGELQNDKKSTITALYTQFIPVPFGARQLYKQSLERKNEYESYINAITTNQEQFNPQKYETFIDNLLLTIPDIIKFIKINASHINTWP